MVILCPRCDSPLNDRAACTKCGHDFSEEVDANIDRGELTSRQIEAQDRIDNACDELIRQFAPKYEHDAQQTAAIRNALVDLLDWFHNIPEYDTYPWLLAPEKESNSTPASSAPASQRVQLMVEYSTSTTQPYQLNYQKKTFDGATPEEARGKIESFFTGISPSGLKRKVSNGMHSIYNYNNGMLVTITKISFQQNEQAGTRP